MMNKKRLLFLTGVFVCLGSQLFCQFGLRLAYTSQSFPALTTVLSTGTGEQSVFPKGVEGGVNYWFRLKKRRIEFLPEFSYFHNAGSRLENLEEATISMAQFGFSTQIYALDLEGDCDCPTFSKQGPSLNKGLFFHFTPSAGRHWSSVRQSATVGSPGKMSESAGWVIRAGLGMGMDIGINDLLTLTPLVSYFFHSNMHWDGLAADGSTTTDQPRQTQFALRVGFRPDYSGRRRY
jgi:hypothetical protein